MSVIKKYYGLALALLLSFWAVKSLFVPGFFSMHDDEQVARLFDLDQALKSWHIPPRIAPNLGFGYGYPFFNFYPPLAYYVAEVFRIIGFSYIESIKLMIGLGFILGSFFMYLLSKEFFGKLGGLISAVFYTYAPYHAVDVYVRGALPEFWSMVFLPAVFWSFYRLSQKINLKFFTLSILFVSSLILAHNLVVIMAVPFMFAWIMILLILSKNRRRFLQASAIVLIWSFLITSYFWMPSFIERKYTMVNLLTTELANYGQHFVYLRQFWNSAWGYGGSIYGLYDGLSFEVGKVHLILSFLVFFLAIKLVLRRKKRIIGVILLSFIALLLLSIFMATFHSKFIWDNIEFLWYIQFPWRFLIFATLFSSFLAGSLALIPMTGKAKVIVVVTVISVLIALNMNYFAPAKFFLTAKDSDYISQEKIRWDASIIAAEYVPKGIATKKSDVGTTVVDINKEEIAKKSFEVISGDMVVTQFQDFPQEKKYKTMSSKKSILRINTYSFPGWKVYIDGQEVQYSDNNKLKLIALQPLVGTHSIVVKLMDTQVRFWGNILSLISIIALIIMILLNIIRDILLERRR